MSTLRGATASMQSWTPSDDERLRKHYAAGGIAAIKLAFPNRTVAALCHRVQRIGAQRRRRWSSKDDADLRALWDGTRGLKAIATLINRTVAATYFRAQRIGLPLGTPAGWEHLTAAARRTGYDTSQLRRILAAADFEIRPVIGRPTVRRGRKKGRRKTFHMAWSADVDLAVEQWHERESVESTARRLGVTNEVLARRLRLIGICKPVDGRKHWRVTEDEARRALKANPPPVPVPELCTHPGCEAPHSAKGLCVRHYHKRQHQIRRMRERRAS